MTSSFTLFVKQDGETLIEVDIEGVTVASVVDDTLLVDDTEIICIIDLVLDIDILPDIDATILWEELLVWPTEFTTEVGDDVTEFSTETEGVLLLDLSLLLALCEGTGKGVLVEESDGSIGVIDMDFVLEASGVLDGVSDGIIFLRSTLTLDDVISNELEDAPQLPMIEFSSSVTIVQPN